MIDIKTNLLTVFLVLVVSDCMASNPKDWQWPESNPEAEGLEQGPLNKLRRLVKGGKYTKNTFKNIDSILIARHGVLIYEKYFNDGAKDRPHQLASAGKSLQSALVGVLIDENHIQGTEVKIFDYFKNYYQDFENWDENKARITLHNILTMRAGWECSIEEPETRCGLLMREGRNKVEALKWLLDRPMSHAPGEKMMYTDANVNLLDTIIYLATGKSVERNFHDELLVPLGITGKFENKLTSREMLMFGQLFLNNGKWSGKQVISEKWVERSTSNLYAFDRKEKGITQGYGYFWWVGRFSSETNDLEVDGFYAMGNGGQIIVVLPELDMVIVFTGSNYGQFARMGNTLKIIERFILPAVSKTEE